MGHLIRSTSVLVLLHLTSAVHCAEDSHFQGPNVAMGKRATQLPLDYQSSAARLAVDGKTKTTLTDIKGVYLCTHTDANGTNQTASWTVDLGHPFIIKGIRIYTRNDGKNHLNSDYIERLQNFTVTGFTEAGAGELLYDDRTSQTEMYRETIINITVTSQTPYRRITVEVPARSTNISYLTLCEVEVYAVLCKFPTVGPTVQAQLVANTGARIESHYIIPGSRIRFSCPNGEHVKPQASSISTCQDDGQYDFQLPTCEKNKPCRGPPARAHVQYVDVKTKYEPGESVLWNCETGFSPQTIQQLTCSQTSAWSTPLPSCSPMTCSYPGRLEHGFYTDHQGQLYTCERVVVGTSVTIVCSTGYGPSVQDIRCTLNGNNASWDRTANCTPITCHPLDDGELNHGTYSYNTAVMASQKYVYGTIARATCLSNFGFTEEENLRSCGAFGNWTGNTGSCAPACQVPTTPNGTYYDENGNSLEWYISGQSVQLKCHTGYELSTTARSSATISRTCFSNHSWDGEQRICTVTEKDDKEDIQSMPIAIITGTAAGAFLLGGIVVFLAMVLHRRRIDNKRDETQVEMTALHDNLYLTFPEVRDNEQPSRQDSQQQQTGINSNLEERPPSQSCENMSLTSPVDHAYRQPSRQDSSQQQTRIKGNGEERPASPTSSYVDMSQTFPVGCHYEQLSRPYSSQQQTYESLPDKQYENVHSIHIDDK